MLVGDWLVCAHRTGCCMACHSWAAGSTAGRLRPADTARTLTDHHWAPLPSPALPPRRPCPHLQALQEQKRDLMRVAFDRRKPEEIREARINDVRMLMDL